MERLPIELLELVLARCDPASIKPLRLVCRSLAAVASPLLFEEVHVALLRQSFEKLSCIANSPRLSKHVKRLVFHEDLLPKLGTQKAWERHIDLRPRFSQFAASQRKVMEHLDYGSRILLNEQYEGLPRLPLDRSKLPEHFRKYQSYQEEQEYWDVAWGDSVFIDAVCKLVNLQHVRSRRNVGHHYSVVPIWRNLAKKILQGPNNWLGMPRVYYGSSDNERVVDGVPQLILLLSALTARSTLPDRRPISSISFDITSEYFWRRYANCVQTGTIQPASAFAHLKHLEATVMYNLEEDPETATSAFADLLRSARSLETLEFQWNEEDGRDPSQPCADLLERLSDVTWPRLRAATVGLASTEQAFTDFLARHSKSLRRLYLKDATIREGCGTWENVIRRIPGLVRLDDIQIESICDETWLAKGYCLLDCWEGGEYERQIIDYCLRGGAFPILDPDEWDRQHPDKLAFASYRPPPEGPPRADHIMAFVSEGQACHVAGNQM